MQSILDHDGSLRFRDGSTDLLQCKAQGKRHCPEDLRLLSAGQVDAPSDHLFFKGVGNHLSVLFVLNFVPDSESVVGHGATLTHITEIDLKRDLRFAYVDLNIAVVAAQDDLKWIVSGHLYFDDEILWSGLVPLSDLGILSFAGGESGPKSGQQHRPHGGPQPLLESNVVVHHVIRLRKRPFIQSFYWGRGIFGYRHLPRSGRNFC